MNMHTSAPGTAEDDAAALLDRWEQAATRSEQARDAADRADTARKLLYDLAVDDMIELARDSDIKMSVSSAERAVSISDKYQKAVADMHRLKLEAGLARIAERKAHHQHEAAVRRTHSERQERRMYGR